MTPPYSYAVQFTCSNCDAVTAGVAGKDPPCRICGQTAGMIPSSVDFGTKDTNPKDAIGAVKPPLTPIPGTALYACGLAMLDGGCKYGRHNYRVSGVRMSIYVDAIMRHTVKYWEGEDIDQDSGLPHMAHVMACCAILLDAAANNKLADDRPPAPDPAWFKQMERAAKRILERYPNPLPPNTRSPLTGD